MMNIEANACNRAVGVATRPAAPETILPGAVEGGQASVAYLVPWGEATAVRFLANALRAGIQVKSTDLAFTHMGRRYPSGPLIVDVADNLVSLKLQAPRGH